MLILFIFIVVTQVFKRFYNYQVFYYIIFHLMLYKTIYLDQLYNSYEIKFLFYLTFSEFVWVILFNLYNYQII